MFERFCAKLVQKVKSDLLIGNPTDMRARVGPLYDAREADKLDAAVRAIALQEAEVEVV